VLNENNKFQDEIDFWKISGFNHACFRMIGVAVVELHRLDTHAGQKPS